MSPVYPTPAGDSLEPIVKVIKDARRQQRENSLPDAAQLGELVQQVQMALANINATVAAAITANSYTKTVIDNLIANPPGNVAIAGTVAAGGRATFNAGITSADVRSRVVTTGYVSVWVDSAGVIGNTASSLRFKQDIEPADPAAEIEALLTLGMVRFRYTADVDEHGDDAPWHLGTLAEYMASKPALAEWVAADADGEPYAINWEHIGIPLIAVVQSLDARLKALEQAL